MPYSNAPPGQWTTATGEKAPAETPVFRDALAKASPAVRDAASFKVEKTNGPILMMGGGDDQLWPSCDLAKIAMEEARHFTFYRRVFTDAVRAVEAARSNPAVDAKRIAVTGGSQGAVVHPLTGELLALGGTPPGIAKAQRDAFGRVDRFLAASLR